MSSWNYTAGVPTFAPCVMYTPSGEHRKANVKYSRLMGASTAIASLRDGKVAWVKVDEAPQVDAWFNSPT